MITSNHDKLDCMISLAMLDSEENDLHNVNPTENAVQFDRSYYKKRSSYIRRYKRRESVRMLKTFALRVAIFTVLLIFSTTVLIGCVPKLNETVYYSVSKWYEEYVTAKYGPSLTDPDISVADIDTQPPTHIESIVTPSLFTDRLIEETVFSDKNNNKLIYRQDESTVLSFSQSTLDERKITFDSTESVFYTVDIGGKSGIAVENENDRTVYLYWSDGNYFYELNSTVYSIGNLIKIAESVK